MIFLNAFILIENLPNQHMPANVIQRYPLIQHPLRRPNCNRLKQSVHNTKFQTSPILLNVFSYVVLFIRQIAKSQAKILVFQLIIIKYRFFRKKFED